MILCILVLFTVVECEYFEFLLISTKFNLNAFVTTQKLDKLIAAETKIPVLIATNPLDCVADGTGICLENADLNVATNKKYI